MARKINSRLIIKGELKAKTPLHVGGYEASVDTDMPLAKNGRGDYYVPGTSLTGVLRAWCERNFDKTEIGERFGPKDKKDDSGHASFVLIEDAIVKLPSGLQSEIRDGVGIDRFYGTAAEGAKFDRAILPKGSKLNFEMTVEIQKDEPQTKSIFGHLLTALENEEIRLGGAKTRGLGRVKFGLTEIKEERFDTFDNILAIFDDSKKRTLSIEKLCNADKNTEPNSDDSRLEIAIKWKPTLPLMNKAGYEGIGVDMLPVTSGVAGKKLSLVLAGSSIKGAFRSHAERIMRTLLDLPSKKKFNEQVKVPVVEELFGAKKEKNTTNPKLGLGALSIDDCYSEASFEQSNWREVESAKTTKTNDQGKEEEVSYSEQELWQAIEKVKTETQSDVKTVEPSPHFHIDHHTAIDRFTGGVAEGALYSVLAPHNIKWQKMTMSLDFGRTQNEKQCLMLLLLVLRDLAENRLPLGFATNRGMGEVKVESIKLKGKNLDSIVPGDISRETKDGKFTANEGLKELGGANWWETV